MNLRELLAREVDCVRIIYETDKGSEVMSFNSAEYGDYDKLINTVLDLFNRDWYAVDFCNSAAPDGEWFLDIFVKHRPFHWQVKFPTQDV